MKTNINIVKVIYQWTDLDEEEHSTTFMLEIDNDKNEDTNIRRWCRNEFAEDIVEAYGDDDSDYLWVDYLWICNKSIPHEDMLVIISHGMARIYSYEERGDV
jgi:hypothetical protein|tara:strand:- start:64 stop:369 length:306 start_codon:yes stop_codon:yes gene_type:complete